MTAPALIYVLVDRETGSVQVGGGSSTRPSPKVYLSLEDARRGLSRINYDRERYVIATYRLVRQENDGVVVIFGHR